MTELVDQFGRSHDYLRISLTERCNLRCTYCMPEEGIALRDKSLFMSREEIFQLAKEFVGLGVKKIRLTGGEPLVRKCVADVISDLSSLDVELSLTTNAILADRYIENFKSGGIRNINVSLDTLRRDRFLEITRRDEFDRVMMNIERLIQEDIHLKINVVLMKGVNDDEIIDFIEYARERPVEVRFIEFMPFNGNQWDWSKGVGMDKIMDVAYHTYGNKVLSISSPENATAKNHRIDGYKGSFGVISTVTNPFCDTCNRIRLTADGKLKNCLFSGNETDLLTPLRHGQDVSNLIRESIYHKKKELAGLPRFDHAIPEELSADNRSMIAIGG